MKNIRSCFIHVAFLLLALTPGLTGASTLLFIDPGNNLSSSAALTKWRQAGFDLYTLQDCPGTATPGQCVLDKTGELEAANKQSLVLVSSASGVPALLSALAKQQQASIERVTAAIVLADAALDRQAIPTNPHPGDVPLTIIIESGNSTELLVAVRQYNRALQRAGFNSRVFVAPPLQENLFNVNRERSALIAIVGQVAGLQKPRNIFEAVMRQHHQWQQPPLDNKPWFSQFAFLKKYPMDKELKRLFATHLESDQHLLAQFPQEHYLAFDLLPYLQKREKLPAGGIGKGFVHMQTHNRSIINLDLSQYAQYDPVIVLALDDEKNLFRLPTFFKTKRQYTWREAERTRLSVRVLGAFLHFQKPVPEELYIALNKRIAIRFDSIEYHSSNPLAVLNDIPNDVLPTIKGNCIYCHQVRKVGGYAGHLNAATGELQGGFALPLESYPEDVLREFLFNQRAVAAKIGVNPNLLPEPEARALFDWLKQEKNGVR